MALFASAALLLYPGALEWRFIPGVSLLDLAGAAILAGVGLGLVIPIACFAIAEIAYRFVVPPSAPITGEAAAESFNALAVAPYAA